MFATAIRQLKRIAVLPLVALILADAVVTSPSQAATRAEIAKYREAVAAYFTEWKRALRVEAAQAGISDETFDKAMKAVTLDWSLRFVATFGLPAMAGLMVLPLMLIVLPRATMAFLFAAVWLASLPASRKWFPVIVTSDTNAVSS